MSFNILAVGQAGRLEFEAILLAASLRQSDPGFPGRLFIAEPQPGASTDPTISAEAPRPPMSDKRCRDAVFIGLQVGRTWRRPQAWMS